MMITEKITEIRDLQERYMDFLPFIQLTVTEKESFEHLNYEDYNKRIEEKRLEKRSRIINEIMRLEDQVKTLKEAKDILKPVVLSAEIISNINQNLNK